MRIAQIHNAYQIPGGEDRVVDLERELLESMGHSVIPYRVTNDRITGTAQKLGAMLQTPYNATARKDLHGWLERERPTVAHVHNFFPLLSPSIYDACADAGVPVVQTLHNFRTLCSGAFMLREGRFCDKCIGGKLYWGVVHRCYRGSLPGSIAVAGMIREYHRDPTRVHRYIALNQFARGMFVKSGLPADRVVVKPNFVNDPGRPEPAARSGGLFVGRFSPDKGVIELVEAWHGIDAPLKIGGRGPLEEQIRQLAPPSASFLGWLNSAQVRAAMTTSAFLVMPSLSTEQFPMALVEAFASGLPVITSRTEALREIVSEGEFGLLCEPGNVEDLRAKIRWAVDHPQDMARMGEAARACYETKYSERINYDMLMKIYEDAIAESRKT